MRDLQWTSYAEVQRCNSKNERFFINKLIFNVVQQDLNQLICCSLYV